MTARDDGDDVGLVVIPKQHRGGTLACVHLNGSAAPATATVIKAQAVAGCNSSQWQCRSAGSARDDVVVAVDVVSN